MAGGTPGKGEEATTWQSKCHVKSFLLQASGILWERTVRGCCLTVFFRQEAVQRTELVLLSAPPSLQKPLLVHRVWVLILKCYLNLSSIHPFTPKRICLLDREKAVTSCPLATGHCPLALKPSPLKRACPPLAAQAVLPDVAQAVTSDAVSSHSGQED